MSQHFGGGCHFEVREENHQAFSLPTFSPFHQGQEGAFRHFEAFRPHECRYPLPTIEINLGGVFQAPPYPCDNGYNNWNNYNNYGNPAAYSGDNGNYPYNQNGNPNYPSNPGADGYSAAPNQPAQPGDYVAPQGIAYDANGNPINPPAAGQTDAPQNASNDQNAGQQPSPGNDQTSGQRPTSANGQAATTDNTDYSGMAEQVANHVPLGTTDSPGFLPAPQTNDGFSAPPSDTPTPAPADNAPQTTPANDSSVQTSDTAQTSDSTAQTSTSTAQTSDSTPTTDSSHYADWAAYVAAHVPLGTTDTPGFLPAPATTDSSTQK